MEGPDAARVPRPALPRLRSRREITSYPGRFDLHRDLERTIHSVEVCEAVFAEEHADDDPEKPRDLRHSAERGRGAAGAIKLITEEANS